MTEQRSVWKMEKDNSPSPHSRSVIHNGRRGTLNFGGLAVTIKITTHKTNDIATTNHPTFLMDNTGQYKFYIRRGISDCYSDDFMSPRWGFCYSTLPSQTMANTCKRNSCNIFLINQGISIQQGCCCYCCWTTSNPCHIHVVYWKIILQSINYDIGIN